MNILLIETATAVCSVALVEIAFTPNGQPALHLLAERSSTSAGAHSTHLPIIIKDMLALQAQQGSPLDAVCVSAGPGSYTGLRIGVSSAKGLCYALGVPLLSVPTLQSMAALYYHQHPDYRGIVCPMIDARRMECYTLIASRQGVLRGVQADVVTEGIYDEWLTRGEVVFIGDGAAKTRPLLGTSSNALYDPAFTLSAMGMAELAAQKLASGQTEDVAYFEPFYLKDFVAKRSVVHGLR